MAIDEERLRQKLRDYDFEPEEIDEIIARAAARDKIMTPEDKERLFRLFFEAMMAGVPYSWDAEGKLQYDQKDMARRRSELQEQMELDEDDDDEDEPDAEDIARH